MCNEEKSTKGGWVKQIKEFHPGDQVQQKLWHATYLWFAETYNANFILLSTVLPLPCDFLSYFCDIQSHLQYSRLTAANSSCVTGCSVEGL